MPRLRLAFTGDVMLGRMVNEFVHGREPEYVWGDVLPLLKKVDLTLINLECVITSHEEKSKIMKPFYFRADPFMIQVLKAADVDYVSLANNHTLDFREEGLLECIDLLDKNRIAHAGAGKDINEALKPAILEAKGIRVAILSYADYPPEWAADENTPGINFTPVTTEEKYFSRVRAAIQQAKQKCDLVIFSVHWGPNMRSFPPQDFIDFAHAVMDAGADIFHGHSAHLFQPIELYKGRPIFYDCGDFVDDYAVDPELRNDYALLYFVVIDTETKKTERVELVPCLIHSYKCQVNIADYVAFEEIWKRVKELCDRVGTNVKRKKNKFVIEVG